MRITDLHMAIQVFLSNEEKELLTKIPESHIINVIELSEREIIIADSLVKKDILVLEKSDTKETEFRYRQPVLFLDRSYHG